MKKISIITPCYNESENIEDLVLQPFRHALFDSESIYSVLELKDDLSIEEISSKLILED